MTVVYEFIDDFEKWISPIFNKLVTPRNAPIAVPAPEADLSA